LDYLLYTFTDCVVLSSSTPSRTVRTSRTPGPTRPCSPHVRARQDPQGQVSLPSWPTSARSNTSCPLLSLRIGKEESSHIGAHFVCFEPSTPPDVSALRWQAAPSRNKSSQKFRHQDQLEQSSSPDSNLVEEQESSRPPSNQQTR
jgi:hypothetical protein